MYGKGSTAKEAFSELLKEIFGLQRRIKSARKTVAAQEKRAKDLEAQNQKLQNALSNLEAKRVRDLAAAEDKHYRELWEVRCAADQQRAEVAHINELRIQNHALLMENKALKTKSTKRKSYETARSHRNHPPGDRRHRPSPGPRHRAPPGHRGRLPQQQDKSAQAHRAPVPVG
jgi:septal ring factor EnvC (AmiA/AmiB activator)